LRINLHVHTAFSFDCWMSLEAVMRAVQWNNKVDAIAVLDHSEIEGALRLSEVAPFPVIAGEEVLTEAGEIGGVLP